MALGMECIRFKQRTL